MVNMLPAISNVSVIQSRRLLFILPKAMRMESRTGIHKAGPRRSASPVLEECFAASASSACCCFGCWACPCMSLPTHSISVHIYPMSGAVLVVLWLLGGSQTRS